MTSAIWQVQTSATDGLEATAGAANTIIFNETPITTSGGHIFTTESNIRRSVPENAKAAGDGNEIQDMGLDGIDIQITGIIKDSDSGATNDNIAKLMTWNKEPQDTTGYTFGRIGLRMDDFQAFRIIPTSDYGAMIQSLRFVRDPNKTNKTGFIMTLRLGGDHAAWFAANGF